MPGELIGETVSRLSDLPPTQIARADAEIAYFAELYHRPVLIRQGGADIFRWHCHAFEHSPAERGLEWIFLFHRNGYQREAALQAISGPISSPFFFTAIAYRLNDWVDQVRKAALACAARSFPKANGAVAAQAAVFLIPQMVQWRRWNDEVGVLDWTFARPEVAEELAGIIRTAVTGPMASVLKQALRQSALDRHLVQLAADARQPAVRATALRTLIGGKAKWQTGFTCKWIDKSQGLRQRVPAIEERTVNRPTSLASLILRGAQDRSAAVRKMSAGGLVQHHRILGNVDELLELLSKDTNRTVLERVEFVRNERGNPAVAR